MGSWTQEMIIPYLITCPLAGGEIPKYISLTSEVCSQATNKLQVINNQPLNGIKKSFAVISKSLTLNDRTSVIRLIEWIHMLQILGCEKIIIFTKSVHPDLMKILEYFQQKGFVDFYDFVEPEEVKTFTYEFIQNFMLQVMQHTDSFYRARNLFKYFVALDTDEVIIPMRPEDRTWHDLMHRYDVTDGTVSIMSYNTIFSDSGMQSYPDIPKHHYMLQHTEVHHKIHHNFKI